MKRILGSRYARISLGIILVGFAGWAFSPYLAYRISSSAFINSDVLRVKAPIPGQLANSLPSAGKYISEDTALPLIKSLSSDKRQLVELQAQKTAAMERVKFDQKQLAEIAATDTELQERLAAYRAGMLTRLNFEIAEAEAEKKGCHAEEDQRRLIGSRLQSLVDSGASSEFKLAEALAQQESTATKCAVVEPRMERLKAELASVEKGVYTRDGSSDVPYSQQQRDRLFQRRQELEADIQQQSSRAAQLVLPIEEEGRRIAFLDQYNLKLPADHVVWSVPASPGSAVIEGQTLLDLADCDHRFVAVELPEREFENIKAGEQAAVRLIGSSEWTYGQIRQVRGSAALDDGRLLAAQVPAPTPGNITVEVALPPDSVAARNAGFCGIGRLAEVRFNREQPAVFERVGQLIKSLFNPSPATATIARE